MILISKIKSNIFFLNVMSLATGSNDPRKITEVFQNCTVNSH